MDAYRLYRMLERRFDGEMPQDLRRAARAGGRPRLEEALLQAAARSLDRQALSAQRRAASDRAEAVFLSAWRAQALSAHPILLKTEPADSRASAMRPALVGQASAVG